MDSQEFPSSILIKRLNSILKNNSNVDESNQIETLIERGYLSH